MAVSAFLDTAWTYGAESVELEWRLPAVHESLAKGMIAMLESCDAFRDIGTVTTRDEYSDTECRKITHADGRVDHLWKRRILKESVDPGAVTRAVSLERYGDPPEGAQFRIYRNKTRRQWAWRCWQVHITEYQTNDPRYSDSDGLLYDIELEFQPRERDMYTYTVDVLVAWGDRLIQELANASRRSTSS